jgi:hypothetical protein
MGLGAPVALRIFVLTYKMNALTIGVLLILAHLTLAKILHAHRQQLKSHADAQSTAILQLVTHIHNVIYVLMQSVPPAKLMM